jgi:hypothetical protein
MTPSSASRRRDVPVPPPGADTATDLPALARQGRRLTSPLAACLLVALFVLVPAVLSGMVSVPDAGTALGHDLRLVVGFLPTLLLVWLWVARYERRSWVTLGFTHRRVGVRLARGFAVGIGVYAVVVAALAAAGAVGVESSPAGAHGWSALGGVLLVGCGYAVQATAEEVAFRGWLLPVVAARTRPWIGVAVSAAMFDLLHLIGNPPHAVYYLNLTLVGVLLGVWALGEGALWGVCAWHTAQNWSHGNWFGLDGGGPVPGGALLDLRATGLPVLTGGDHGLSHGLALTVVLVAALVLVTRRYRRRRPAPGDAGTAAVTR